MGTGIEDAEDLREDEAALGILLDEADTGLRPDDGESFSLPLVRALGAGRRDTFFGDSGTDDGDFSAEALLCGFGMRETFWV